MTLYKKRERFSKLSIRVGMVFSKVGLSPNQWTLLSFVPAVFSFYFLIQRYFLPAAILFFLSSFIDWIDGSIARVMGKVSKLGAYLDTIMDRYVEAIVLLGLLFANLPDFYLPIYAWLFLYLLGSFMTTYAKSAAKEKNLVEGELRGGLLERAERLIILFFGILLAHLNPIYLTYVIVILAVLTNVSALQRMWIATRK